jgi:hypothetical protein
VGRVHTSFQAGRSGSHAARGSGVVRRRASCGRFGPCAVSWLCGAPRRLALELVRLGKPPAATATEAAAEATAAAAPGARARRGGAAGLRAHDGDGGGVDLHAACVPEMSLLQAPVAAFEARVRALLTDYPDHPLLLQLRAVALRLLGLPLRAPLKTALTGLELLLSRAQVRPALPNPRGARCSVLRGPLYCTRVAQVPLSLPDYPGLVLALTALSRFPPSAAVGGDGGVVRDAQSAAGARGGARSPLAPPGAG